MECPPRPPIEEDVLSAIRPTGFQLRALDRVYGLVRSALDGALSSRGLSYVIEAEGSYAKGTLLRDRWEMDVFVLFRDVDEGWLMSRSLDLIEGALSGLPAVRKYSEHPYLTVSLMGIEVDVVPAIYSESPRLSLGVGRTPFHTRYVRSRLTGCQSDDVRLLKSFLKGIGAYGAEVQVGGFSGYMAELMVISYGSFRAALEAMSSWRPPVYVDPEGRGSRRELEARYPDSPLIFVDPVDPGRNAAAAVTYEKLSLAVIAAKLYLQAPSRSFFHAFSGSVELKVRPPLVLAVCRGDYFQQPPEAVWGKAARLSRELRNELEGAGFTPLRASYFTDEGALVAIGVALASGRLTGLEVLDGPDAWADVENVRAFVRRRLEEGGLWVGERLYGFRPWRRPEALSLVEAWLSRRGSELGRSCEAFLVEGDGGMPGRLPKPVRDWAWREFYAIPSWLVGL